MEIVSIFGENLTAIKYESNSSDELERVFDLWNDTAYLEEFFNANLADLKYYNLTIDEAIEYTIEEANLLSEKLFDALHDNPINLEPLFKNLDNNEVSIISLAKQKAHRRWLRLYAIRIDANVYLITGGAIKLTERMEDRSHTAEELSKLERCKQFLHQNGVFDSDSFKELLNE